MLWQGHTQASSACSFVGMVHAGALPGSAGWRGDMHAVVAAAVRDAARLVEGGCDALIVENMHDTPYLRGRVLPETVAAMAVVVEKVVGLGLPVGVQVLAGANRQALGVAVAAGACFVRAEAFAYAHVADEGLMSASAGPLLRARRALDVHMPIWADVQKKHAAHAITADLSMEQLAEGHAFCGADVLVVTGSATGTAASHDDAVAARRAGLPVVIGSGVTVDNVAAWARVADAVIVGSWLKEEGDWRRPVDLARVVALRDALGRGV